MTFKIIFNTKTLSYKIQRRLLWGLIWYDVTEDEWNGTDLVSYPKYFNSLEEAKEYIQKWFIKGKDIVIKIYRYA